jgi:hypothetical protein
MHSALSTVTAGGVGGFGVGGGGLLGYGDVDSAVDVGIVGGEGSSSRRGGSGIGNGSGRMRSRSRFGSTRG